MKRTVVMEKTRNAQKATFDQSQGFFGAPLDHEAPIIMCDCLAFIRNRGLYDVGVFRVTGSLDVVGKLKERYNAEFTTKDQKENNEISILNEFKPSPTVNDVASLLKAFFKDLDGSLIPAAIAREMMEIIGRNDPKEVETKALSAAVKKMPTPNRECLGFLISFLREICTFKKFNQMGAENLATCFVLSIMGGNDAFDQLAILGKGAVVVKKLITSPVKVYMPSVQHVQKNTRYEDVRWPIEGGSSESLTQSFKVSDKKNKYKSRRERSKTLKPDQRGMSQEEQLLMASSRSASNRKKANTLRPMRKTKVDKKKKKGTKYNRQQMNKKGSRNVAIAASLAFPVDNSMTAKPLLPKAPPRRKGSKEKDVDPFPGQAPIPPPQTHRNARQLRNTFELDTNISGHRYQEPNV